MTLRSLVGDPPTPRQLDVLRSIYTLSAAVGYPPTLREVTRALGLRAVNGIWEHAQRLRHKGLLCASHGSRTLRLTVLGERRARDRRAV